MFRKIYIRILTRVIAELSQERCNALAQSGASDLIFDSKAVLA